MSHALGVTALVVGVKRRAARARARALPLSLSLSRAGERGRGSASDVRGERGATRSLRAPPWRAASVAAPLPFPLFASPAPRSCRGDPRHRSRSLAAVVVARVVVAVLSVGPCSASSGECALALAALALGHARQTPPFDPLTFGKYERVRLRGEGSFGAVWEIRAKADPSRRHALKMIDVNDVASANSGILEANQKSEIRHKK